MEQRNPPRHLYLPTYFHLGYDEAEWWVEEQGYLPIQIGQHILSGNGELYKVIDVWLSLDHHGVFNDGQHVFMERAELPREQFTPRLLEYFSDAD